MDATETLLARSGYQKMTIEDIAREAGIGRRTVYTHFSNKEEITLASIDRVVQRVLSDLSSIAQSSTQPEVRLSEMLVARVMLRFDKVRDYHTGLEEVFSAIRGAYMARRAVYFEAEAHIFAEVLEQGKRDGSFAIKDSLPTAKTLILATNSLIPYSLSPAELGRRKDVEQRAAAIADLLVRGLAE